MSCHYCGTTDRDLRPYGPAGSQVCFQCATSTPERNQETEGRFGALLDAASAVNGGIVVLEDGKLS